MRRLFVTMALVVLTACTKSPAAPTPTTPTQPGLKPPEVVNSTPSAPTEYYDSPAGYTAVKDAQGINRQVDVPAGMYRVIPLKFDPGRHSPMPTAPESTIAYTAMACVSADMPVSSDVISFRLVASGYNTNGSDAMISSWSSGDLIPGKCSTSSTTMTRSTPGGVVEFMRYVFIRKSQSRLGPDESVEDGIPNVMVPVDWGPR